MKIKGNINEIEKKVKTENDKIKILSDKEHVLNLKIADSELIINQFNNEIKENETKLNNLKSNKIQLESEIKYLKKEINNTEKNALKRLRAIFINSNKNTLEKLFSNVSQDSIRNAYLLKKIKEYDYALIKKLVSLRKDFVLKEQSFNQNILDLENILQEIKLKYEKITSEFELKKTNMHLIQQDKNKIQTSLESLKLEADRLDSVLASLMGSAVENDVDTSKINTDTTSAGIGIPGSPGIPVRGKILKRFGYEKLKDFDDMVFNKGIEFSANENENVISIAKGTVKFIGEMPGFEKVLIIDHGKREYSLYGRLGNITVNIDDIVESGQVVGKTSKKDLKSRNFYFEIRKSGVSQNPGKYFGKTFDIIDMNFKSVRG